VNFILWPSYKARFEESEREKKYWFAQATALRHQVNQLVTRPIEPNAWKVALDTANEELAAHRESIKHIRTQAIKDAIRRLEALLPASPYVQENHPITK
jgi:benzoyl-CoA reductase/2-hydroxyglutaryl-CoA dehydratase subunit BcrC/BadD/HgdB